MTRVEEDSAVESAASAEVEARLHSLLIVRPTLAQGGADRVTITLLESLDRSVVDPSLALFRREGVYLDRVPDDVELLILGARSLWTAWWPLAKHIRRHSPDIVFSTCSGTNVALCIAGLLTGGQSRLVLSERNVLFRDQPLLKKWLIIAAKRLLYRAADCVTAVSTGVADDLTAYLRVEPHRIRTVYNPIVGSELEQLAAENVPDMAPAAGDPLILAAGRLVPAKGFDVLLDAFAVVNHHLPARLVILGEGPQRDNLERRAADLGLADRIFLPGFVRNPLSYMARCDVFALSSRHEGLPGVLIQAMACGAAVVATDCHAGPREIISNGADGLLIPVDDSRKMASALLDLLQNPQLRQRLGAAARQSVARFQRKAVVADYLDALIGALPPSPGNASRPGSSLGTVNPN
ncbi:MAG: glycosyltransferase [Acidobacteriota bacterium]|nr:glycosyltransferase [Acidobacteriota bacterium]